MKHFKKIKAYISFVLLTSLFIQPLFLPVQLIASHKHCNQQTSQEEYFTERQYPAEHSERRNDLTYYIDIMPETLDGLNLKELFRLIIEYAYKTNTLLELPQELMNCCKALEDDAISLFMPDLVEALPIVIEKMMDPIMQDMLRAPRPGTNGAIVGPLVDCNIDEVVTLLDKLINQIKACCNNQQNNLNVTFTVLNDINTTLTTCCESIAFNFDGTFTAIAAISTPTVTVVCDFSSLFTILNDISITLTTSCSANFENTFTVLEDIRATLTTCCANIEFNFEGTFTAIAAITTPTVTVACDFSSLFTAIDAITTPTVTVVCDFSSLFTAIDAITTPTVTIVCDFSSLFTAIDAITTPTVTVVCDFSSLFTAIDAITTLTVTVACDFSSLFTAIDANAFTSVQSLCTGSSITQGLIDAAGGTFVINSSGNYVLASDVTSTASIVIIINASNVTLDLCGHTIVGVSSTLIGIQVNVGLTNVTILNGSIDPVALDGIHVLSGNTGLNIDNVHVSGAARAGINLDGFSGGITPIREGTITNCEVILSATSLSGLGGLVLNNCDTVKVQGGIFNRNGSAAAIIAAGVLLTTCSNCNVDGVFTNENIATATACGCQATRGANNTFINCTSSNNSSAAGSAFGFALGAGESFSSVIDCSAEGNRTSSPSFGSATTAIVGAGIFVNGANGAAFNNLTHNTIINNSTFGIFDNNLIASLLGSSLSIVSGASTTLLSQNSAINNGQTGAIGFPLNQPYPNYLVAYHTASLTFIFPIVVQFSYSLGLSSLSLTTNSIYGSQLSNLSMIP
jgi:hypothetical protein